MKKTQIYDIKLLKKGRGNRFVSTYLRDSQTGQFFVPQGTFTTLVYFPTEMLYHFSVTSKKT